jgi:methyl-accepting chemotaxis protein
MSTIRTIMTVALLALALPAAAQNVPAEPAAPPELSAQDREVLAAANQLAAEAAQAMERWIAAKEVTEERLRSRLYYPIAGTDPIKFKTDYDALAERDLVAPQEKALARSSAYVYAVIADVNGYVPAHNQKFSQPLTGNRAVDLVNNRTKRIFGDRVGLAAARNEAPYLIQRYERDTGEPMADLSVPLVVRGKRFGCVRIGYAREQK